MGYETNYSGEIFLYDKKAIKIIKESLEKEEYPFDDIDGVISILKSGKKTILDINGNWRDYDDEMLKLCLFVATLDKKGCGIIDCEGEESPDIWKISIESGKVQRVQGIIKYDYKNQEEFNDAEIKKKVYDITKDKQLLRELMIEKLE